MRYHKQIIILTKKSDTIHAVTPMKYQKYPSTILLKYAIVLAELIKSHDVNLFNMNPQ